MAPKAKAKVRKTAAERKEDRRQRTLTAAKVKGEAAARTWARHGGSSELFAKAVALQLKQAQGALAGDKGKETAERQTMRILYRQTADTVMQPDTLRKLEALERDMTSKTRGGRRTAIPEHAERWKREARRAIRKAKGRAKRSAARASSSAAASSSMAAPKAPRAAATKGTIQLFRWADGELIPTRRLPKAQAPKLAPPKRAVPRLAKRREVRRPALLLV